MERARCADDISGLQVGGARETASVETELANGVVRPLLHKAARRR